MARTTGWDAMLACCHGFSVAARGTAVGAVETPLFAGAAQGPDHLVIRVSGRIAGTFRVAPAALVADVDGPRRTITLALDPQGVAALPERLPLEGR